MTTPHQSNPSQCQWSNNGPLPQCTEDATTRIGNIPLCAEHGDRSAMKPRQSEEATAKERISGMVCTIEAGEKIRVTNNNGETCTVERIQWSGSDVKLSNCIVGVPMKMIEINWQARAEAAESRLHSTECNFATTEGEWRSLASLLDGETTEECVASLHKLIAYKAVAGRIGPYMKEIISEHADQNAAAYNECDDEPCEWCLNVKQAMAELERLGEKRA